MTDKIECGGLIRRNNLCLLEIQGYDLKESGRFDILGLFGKAKIPISYLAVGNGPNGCRNMSLCVPREHLATLESLKEDLQEGCSPRSLKITDHTMILTVYGPHFHERASVAGVVYGALKWEQIYTHSINSSVNSISFVINESDCERTIACLRSMISWPE
jgi:aspartokinase